MLAVVGPVGQRRHPRRTVAELVLSGDHRVGIALKDVSGARDYYLREFVRVVVGVDLHESVDPR
jgi:hypothetical protein